MSESDRDPGICDALTSKSIMQALDSIQCIIRVIYTLQNVLGFIDKILCYSFFLSFYLWGRKSDFVTQDQKDCLEPLYTDWM